MHRRNYQRVGLPWLALAAFTTACASGGGGASCPDIVPTEATDAQRVLLDPANEIFKQIPPDTFHVRFETSKGEFVVQVIRAWAPTGALQFYNLVRNGFYNDARFFRVLPGFVVQFGMSGVPGIQKAWDELPLRDDPVATSNVRGTITFAATAEPDSRTTQVFISLGDNAQLDGMGFAPFGRVVQGLENVERFYADYGEMQPMGPGPLPDCIARSGNAYLSQQFPQLDYITRASVLEPGTEVP
jgi:peptidyl-prolyl cis-trans isomerase A (cyclophilin A)